MASQTDPSHTKHHTTPDGTKYSYIYHAPQPNKPTLLLLHGFPSATWDWRALLPLLSAEGVGIIAPDLLGYGDTDKPHAVEDYRMKRMSAHVESILDAEGTKTVVGVAHDWGCGLLSHMWVYAPARFTQLVFISVAHLPPGFLDIDGLNAMSTKDIGYEIFGYWEFFGSEDAPQVIQDNHKVFQKICYVKDPDMWKTEMAPTGALRKNLESGKGTDVKSWCGEDDLKVHSEIMLKGGYRGPTNWYKQALRGCNNEDYAQLKGGEDKVTVPLLFISTTKDAICRGPYMLAGMAGKVDDLTVNEIETGHWGIMEKPREMFESMKNFIKW